MEHAIIKALQVIYFCEDFPNKILKLNGKNSLQNLRDVLDYAEDLDEILNSNQGFIDKTKYDNLDSYMILEAKNDDFL